MEQHEVRSSLREEDGSVEEGTSSTGNAPLESWKLAMVMGALSLAIFLYGLDMNVIGVAIPKITTEFNSLDDVAWYGSAYLLTITAFQPLFGNFYKYFNAKLVYLISIAIFEVGSVICAAAPTSSVLIFGRAFLGFGAAGLLQGALAIIGYSVRLDKVPLYQGVVVSSLGISVCTGPLIGGALTDHASWRWCFWINVPVGIAVLFTVLIFVTLNDASNQKNRDLPLQKKVQHMDPLGTVIFLSAVCCLLIILQLGGQKIAWASARAVMLFLGFGFLIAVFCFLQWEKGEYATIPPRILMKRSIYMGALVLFFLGMSSLTYAYFLPIYFQSIQGVSATASGVRFIALVLPQIVGLVITGAIVSTWGYYVPYIIAGVVVTSIGAGLLTTLDAYTPTVKWAAYMVINGLGIGMAQQLPYAALQAVLEPSDVPTGNAIAVFSYQLGGGLSVAIAQNLFLNKLIKTIPRHTTAVSPLEVIAVGATGLAKLAKADDVLRALREAYAEALHDAFIFAVVAACGAFPFGWCMQWLNIKKVAEERAKRIEVTEREEREHIENEKSGERRVELTE
ncbi:efflux pump antibiotic resistance protein [Lindgomyces ingoldianus]|uniref:Efflux pump antibiotic resistance protein n=1 Tax=Lindgomyces ingoldianus TaxID=673940 RepID=A0ACB6QC00_9PLEO|nr:efflux pump antibiotic resistance protein [Lindgomyces ingoldianus]KAF2464463.1 efflux pump antibiotic resistance protein [Lindgomyces ingoldianus]